MATYKVLQDIEAEDKFVGPLTLKQFIFAAIAVTGSYLCFVFLSKGMWVLVFPFVPVILVTGFLAFPWGRDQPTEVWLLAKIRFYFKPRQRVWDQTGMQELVKITAPPVLQEYTSDNLSQTEVKSRLRALADTIDSRGWAIKNVSGQPMNTASDRLVDASSLPQVASTLDTSGVSDIFETSSSQQLDAKLNQQSQQLKENTVQRMEDIQSETTHAPAVSAPWFMTQGAAADGLSTFGAQTVVDDPPITNTDFLPAEFRNPNQDVSADDSKLLSEIKHKRDLDHQHFQNHRNLSTTPISPVNDMLPSVTTTPYPATIGLAGNSDRTVESLARDKSLQDNDIDGEIVVPLH